MTAIDNTEQRT